MKLKFEKAQFDVHAMQGKKTKYVAVDGYVLNKFLGIHHNTFEDVWVVDHLPTGWSAWRAPTFAKAKRLCVEFAALDWDFKSPKSKKLEKLRPAVEAIASKVLK